MLMSSRKSFGMLLAALAVIVPAHFAKANPEKPKSSVQISMPVQASGISLHAKLTLNTYPDLCNLILKQVQEKLNESGSACTAPYANARKGISLPTWEAVDVDEHIDILKKIIKTNRNSFVIAFASLSAHPVPEKTRELLKSPDALTPLIADAIRSGRGKLEITSIDIDNAGGIEKVYRLTAMQLTDSAKPTDWSPQYCDQGKTTQASPYVSVIFVDGDAGRFWTFNRMASGEDLFVYRGRAYTYFRDSTVPYVSWNRSVASSGAAYRTPACNIHTIYRRH